MTNPRSTASIAGHPVHPMLIPFPIAFFGGAFIADLGFWISHKSIWANGSVWVLGAGLIMAALAAVVGLTEMFGDARIRNLNDARLHAGGTALVVIIEFINWYFRVRNGTSFVLPTGIILSLIVVLILLFAGWKGWELVHRHRVGIADA